MLFFNKATILANSYWTHYKIMPQNTQLKHCCTVTHKKGLFVQLLYTLPFTPPPTPPRLPCSMLTAYTCSLAPPPPLLSVLTMLTAMGTFQVSLCSRRLSIMGRMVLGNT